MMRLVLLSTWLALLSWTSLLFQSGCRGVRDDGYEVEDLLPFAWTKRCQEIAFKLEHLFSRPSDTTTCTEACDELFKNVKRKLGQGVVAERCQFYEYSETTITLCIAGDQGFTFFFDPCMVQTFLCLRQSASDDLSQKRQSGESNCLAHPSTSGLKQACGSTPVGRTCRCEIILILRKLLMKSVDHEDIGQFGCSAEEICFRTRSLLGSNWMCHSKALLRRNIRCREINLRRASQGFPMCACNEAKKGSGKYEAACQDLSQVEFLPFSPPASTNPRVQEQLVLHSLELYRRYLHQWTQPGLRDYLLPEDLRLNTAGLDRIPRMTINLKRQRIEKMKDSSDRLVPRGGTDSGPSGQLIPSPVDSATVQSRGSDQPSKRKSGVAALYPSRLRSLKSSICYINAVDVQKGEASGTSLTIAREGIPLASRAGIGSFQTPPIHLGETEQLQTTMQSFEKISNRQIPACEGFSDAGPVASLASAPTRPVFDLDQLFNADPRLHLASDPVQQLDTVKQGFNTAKSLQDAITLAPLLTSSAEQTNVRSSFAIEDQDSFFADLDPLPHVNLGSQESIQRASVSEMPQAAIAEDQAFTTRFFPWEFL